MTPSTLALARRVRALLEAPGDQSPWQIMESLSQRDAAFYELVEALEVACGDDLYTWMDVILPPVTHADVLALLDRVIAEGER